MIFLSQVEMKRCWEAIGKQVVPLYSSFNNRWQIEERKQFADYFRKKALVLSIGCGYGRDLRLFQKLGLTAIGIDFSKQMLSKSMTKNIVEASATNIPFKQNTFDGVWSCSMIKYLELSDVSKCFKEIRRVLKPNGLLWLGLDEGKEKKTEDRGGTNVTFNTYTDLDQVLEMHSFKILSTQKIYAWRNFMNILCANSPKKECL